MAGKRQKPYSQLQNKRGARRRNMVLLDMGGGSTWEVPYGSMAHLNALTPQAPWREPEPSAKAVIARQKPRDDKGRFVPSRPADAA